MFRLSDLSISFHNQSYWYVVLVAVLAVFLTIRLYKKTNPPISRLVRLVFIVLRFVALLTLFISLLSPILSYKRTFQRKPRLSLLVDYSLSIDKKINGVSRKEIIDSLLISEQLKKIKSNVDLSLYYFGGNFSENKQMINRNQTAIGDALKELNLVELESPFDYRFLISDGNNNSGNDPVSVFQNVYQSINTVDISLSGKKSDIGIDKIDVNKILYAGEDTEVKVKIKWKNIVNQNIDVELLEDNKIITGKNININQLNGLSDLTLAYQPSSPGQKLLKIKTSAVENEENTNNNSNTVSVNVLKSKLAVLLVSENPDYEVSFLKRLLEKSDKYNLDFRIIGNKSGNLKSNFPAKQIELNSYDLIILHDPNLDKIYNKTKYIKSYLYDRGGSLWVMMGKNIGSQRISDEFRELLPFYPSNTNYMMNVNFSGEPNNEFIFHPIVSIGQNRKEINETWSNLPPFEFLILSDNINPSASVLVTANGINQIEIPIIGYINYGSGKVFTTGALPFWTWGFVNKGFDEDDSFYNEFVNETVSWLTVTDDFDPIRISTDKDIYNRLDQINFTAYALDVGYRPLSGVSGIITVVNEKNNKSFEKDLKSVSNGKLVADFTNLSSGQYSYTAKFIKDNIMLKEISGKFLIEPYSIEEFDDEGNSEVLEQIANISGGKYYQFKDFNKALLNIDLKKKVVNEEGEVNLSNRFLFLLIFLIAISTEWFLRRFYQLI